MKPESTPPSTPETHERSYWPHAIITWFIIFVAAMAAWVSFAVRQKMDLVREDYYEEEVRFQNQLDRMNRTAGIQQALDVRYDAQESQLTIQLPKPTDGGGLNGQVSFYRASDARLDFHLPVAVDATGLQRIGTKSMRGGQWKVRIQWMMGKQDYFYEKVVVLEDPGPSISAVSTSPN